MTHFKDLLDDLRTRISSGELALPEVSEAVDLTEDGVRNWLRGSVSRPPAGRVAKLEALLDRVRAGSHRTPMTASSKAEEALRLLASATSHTARCRTSECLTCRLAGALADMINGGAR